MHLNERKCTDVSPKDSSSLRRAEKVKGEKKPTFLPSELQTARNHHNQSSAFYVFLLLVFLPLPLPCLFVSASDELIGVGVD